MKDVFRQLSRATEYFLYIFGLFLMVSHMISGSFGKTVAQPLFSTFVLVNTSRFVGCGGRHFLREIFITLVVVI